MDISQPMFPSRAGLMAQEVLGPQAGALAPRATGHRRLRRSGRLSTSRPWNDFGPLALDGHQEGGDLGGLGGSGFREARLLVKLRDSPDQVLYFLAPALGVEESCTPTRVAMQLIKGGTGG